MQPHEAVTTGSQSLRLTWSEGPGYPIFIKGCAAGVVDGRLYVAGGMSYPWHSLDYGFWLQTGEAPEQPPAFWRRAASASTTRGGHGICSPSSRSRSAGRRVAPSPEAWPS
jgi:hypothetical protein